MEEGDFEERKESWGLEAEKKENNSEWKKKKKEQEAIARNGRVYNDEHMCHSHSKLDLFAHL